MTSSVSVVSDFVANGHQIFPSDSCSPSKIPYGGFSPVRLQTGFQPRPSSTRPELKRMTRIPSNPADLYAAKVQVSSPIVSEALCLPRQFSGDVNHGRSRPEALGSPEGYAVPPGHRLLWPHPKLSASPASLSASSRQVFAPRPGGGRSREAPQFTPPVSLTVPPSVPRQTRWNQHKPSRFRLRTFRFQPFRLLVPKSLKPCPCLLYPRTVLSLPSTLAFASSVQARRLHSSTQSVLGWAVLRGCNIRFMLRPGELLALHRQELLLSSFRFLGSPPGNVDYNYPAKQSIAGAGLSPARHAALWAANRGHRTLFNIPFALQPLIKVFSLVHAVHDQMCRHSC